MSQKDYNKIARAFLSTRPSKTAEASVIIQWQHDMQAIVKVLEQDNPRFDKHIFINAVYRGI